MVVLDSSGELVNGLMRDLPSGVMGWVRHLDYSGGDRVAAVNLLDPVLFPDEQECVGNLVRAMRYTWDRWGNRTEDMVTKGLSMLYRYNGHPGTGPSEQMGFLDLLTLLGPGVRVGTGVHAFVGATEFQRVVLRRSGERLSSWFDAYLRWDEDARSEAFAPLDTHLGAYASHPASAAALGQRSSLVSASDLAADGLLVLASLPAAVLGREPAGILGAAFSGLLLGGSRRWVVCDGLDAFPGVDWETLVDRDTGGVLMASARSVSAVCGADLDGLRRSSLLGSFGVLASLVVSGEDSRALAHEFDVGPSELMRQGPWQCRVRVAVPGEGYRVHSVEVRAGGWEASAASVARSWSEGVSVSVDGGVFWGVV